MTIQQEVFDCVSTRVTMPAFANALAVRSKVPNITVFIKKILITYNIRLKYIISNEKHIINLAQIFSITV